MSQKHAFAGLTASLVTCFRRGTRLTFVLSSSAEAACCGGDRAVSLGGGRGSLCRSLGIERLEALRKLETVGPGAACPCGRGGGTVEEVAEPGWVAVPGASPGRRGGCRPGAVEWLPHPLTLCQLF